MLFGEGEIRFHSESGCVPSPGRKRSFLSLTQFLRSDPIKTIGRIHQLVSDTRKALVLARLVAVLLLAVMALPVWAGEIAPVAEQRVLARVDVNSALETLGLPIYAHLTDAAGREYIVTIAPQTTLNHLTVSYDILDANATENHYYLARERRPGARVLAPVTTAAQVLHDDGLRLIVRETPGVDDALLALGFDLKKLPDTPVILAPRPARAQAAAAVAVNPLVSEVISQVSLENLTSYVSGLSGVKPVTVGGSAYTIATRHTKSGAPIQNATQFVYERFQALGLNSSYHSWTGGGISNRNVIGELRGVSTPDEIVLITAHIDDAPSGGIAPGADDNASGCAAILVAADIMSRYQFNRTVRFVLFTGEEQGMYGSGAYANSLVGKNIVATFNMDMIAFNTAGTAPTLIIHTRPATNPGSAGDLAIANTFTSIVSGYGLASALTPRIRKDGESESDHSSFWDAGFAAVLAIEDDYDDFNPYYHSVNDTLNRLDTTYFTAYVKAVVGTVAQLAAVSSSSGLPTITGLTPAGMAQGSSGKSLIISGANLTGAGLAISGSGVTFGTAAITATQITVPVTVAATAATGARILTVTTAGGSATATFTVTASSAATLFSDGFEGSGWATSQVSGTKGGWTLVASGRYPPASPHGGTKLAAFNSYTSRSGNQTRLYRATGVAVPATATTVTLKFWMYHDTGYSTSADRVQPQVSTTGATWTNAGSSISRYNGTIGWAQVSVDLSAYKGKTVYLGFVGISAYGNDIYLDDVSVVTQ